MKTVLIILVFCVFCTIAYFLGYSAGFTNNIAEELIEKYEKDIEEIIEKQKKDDI